MVEWGMGEKYASFDDLLKRNRSFFQLFEKRVSVGLLRALWDARQIEVDGPIRRIGELEEDLSRWKEKSLEGEKRIKELEDELAARALAARCREKGIQDLEDRLSSLEMGIETRERDLECLRGAAEELERAKGEIGTLTVEGKKWREACRKLEAALAEKSHQWDEQSLGLRRLERELADARASLRTAKALNDRMSGELSKLTLGRGFSSSRDSYSVGYSGT